MDVPNEDEVPCGCGAGCSGAGSSADVMSIGVSPESGSSIESAESSERLSAGRLADRKVDVTEFQSEMEEPMDARGAQSGPVGVLEICGECAGVEAAEGSGF